MSEIKYEIIKNIAVLSTSASGWSKELNLISWNDREPKYDLRDWSADHSKMGKGVTLTKEELLALKEILMHDEIIE
ncbi:MAG TPA: PC4/YdbC family ssDNA-binding protein [Anaerolineales bacterium]|nr:PC4/YdbC family ssDNA-binding protein [Anaerolineales bacterium]